ncbi:3-phosphoserine/phosphohydroxythreonine transaminase [Lactococcus allomyrinae]|uniref:Phosphoserine aminotransferase n=1 Tax=Lactococcus allomyrinae TaxID=2419773 RepID=A0A387B8Y2_9LACT|nr:3-phosphoserine/phosphohydroxythreonine transaminase [Lactococcus allomyrinae]AYG00163.1 3-phosphoserine/phosphohydroxythreonine transaminase [Lactococcus allomyrinae]
MMIYNFAAGPAVLPQEVLRKAQKEFLNYANSGMSVMELTHRGKLFSEIITHAEETLRELMNIPDHYKILFLQGGASTQFTMVPLNLALEKKAYYTISGLFGQKAYEEAVKLSKKLDLEPIILSESKGDHFTKIAQFDKCQVDPEAAYVHLTMNNTIEGSSIYELPETNGVPIVGDMSSNILAVKYDINKFGLVYAGAQKNIGPAGVTIVIVREDLLPHQEMLSSMLDYQLLIKNHSLYNTPPTFGIYMAGLVFDWVKSLGGVDEMEKLNREKAVLLYDYLDSTTFYQTPIKNKAERSICNIPFTTSDESLDQLFVKQADESGLKNLKGHRSVGGMRASIYNAFPRDGVVELVRFMKKFEKEH